MQTELDPATPYPLATDAHTRTPATRLLSVDDQGNHGAYAGGGNPCVDKVVTDFLDAGRLIDTDAVCPAVPLPEESQVHPVGTTLPGTRLDMPQPPRQGLGEVLRKLLLALLDQVFKPRH